MLAFLFEFQYNRHELFDVRRGDIVAVGPLNERFALEVEDGDQAGHGDARLYTVRPSQRQSYTEQKTGAVKSSRVQQPR